VYANGGGRQRARDATTTPTREKTVRTFAHVCETRRCETHLTGFDLIAAAAHDLSVLRLAQLKLGTPRSH
jgi:hypothetical protein